MTFLNFVRRGAGDAPVLALAAVIIGVCAAGHTTLAAQALPGASGAAPQPNKQDASAPPGYRIGEGDVLSIRVWNEPGASIDSVVVRPDGKITLPLLKEVQALDLTPAELQKLITSKLDPQFIRGADVTVVVREIHSKRVFLIGAVKKEGPVPLLSNMTVLQVLSEAGGLTDFAKRKKILILRNENGKQQKYPFNYDAVIKGEHVEQNIQVMPGDMIVVPH